MYLGIGERFELSRHLVGIGERQASGRKETPYTLFQQASPAPLPKIPTVGIGEIQAKTTFMASNKYLHACRNRGDSS